MCDDGHVTEHVGRYDEEEIPCLWATGVGHVGICWKDAHRQAVYRSQGVIFKGPDFTRSVIVPDPPRPTSTAELTTDQRMEVLDDYAKENHKYDTEVLPYKKEERRVDSDRSS